MSSVATSPGVATSPECSLCHQVIFGGVVKDPKKSEYVFHKYCLAEYVQTKTEYPDGTKISGITLLTDLTDRKEAIVSAIKAGNLNLARWLILTEHTKAYTRDFKFYFEELHEHILSDSSFAEPLTIARHDLVKETPEYRHALSNYQMGYWTSMQFRETELSLMESFGEKTPS